MAVVKQEGGAGLYGRRSPIERWVRGGSARDGLRYSEVDTEEREEAGFMARLPAGLSSPRDTEPRPSPMDQANSVTSLLLILRMLHSRRVLYKSFSVPASVEHPFLSPQSRGDYKTGGMGRKRWGIATGEARLCVV